MQAGCMTASISLNGQCHCSGKCKCRSERSLSSMGRYSEDGRTSGMIAEVSLAARAGSLGATSLQTPYRLQSTVPNSLPFEGQQQTFTSFALKNDTHGRKTDLYQTLQAIPPESFVWTGLYHCSSGKTRMPHIAQRRALTCTRS